MEQDDTPILESNEDSLQQQDQKPPQQPPSKKRRSMKGDDIDEMLINSIKTIQERRQEKHSRQLNEETHFGLQVAETLRRFSPKQKALAKLQIDQVLFNIEFPPEQPYYPPPPMNP